MRALGAGLIGALAALGGAEAQPAPPVPACRSILDASERLHCYDEEANFDFSAVISRELDCGRPRKVADVLKLLIRRSLIRSMAFHVADDVNYFALAKPEKVDGLTVIAVFGFDDSGQFPFVRSRGTASGPVFGVVTRDSQAELDAWRLRHSPALMIDDTGSSMKGAKDVACLRLAPVPAPASASGARRQAPAQTTRPAEDPFEAGLAPKLR
ncbi:MAG: hypothetical protein JWR08_2708 [Enterovirga sp.]|nr:hypothetical protein [Enterovirga sp.]